MKRYGILITIIIFSLLFVSCNTNSKNQAGTETFSTNQTDITTTTQSSNGVDTTESTTIDKEEEDFYNSMTPEERTVYDRVRYDKKFLIEDGRSYDRSVEKQKEIKMFDSNIPIDYCFTFTRGEQCTRNPENIDLESSVSVFLDKDKNQYMFDSQGTFRQYAAYFSLDYNNEAEKNKISVDDVLNKIYSLSETILPELKDLPLVENKDSGKEYFFVFQKRLSDIFVEEIQILTYCDGNFKFIFNNVYSDRQEVSQEEQKKILDKLDSFIKSQYGDEIKSYDYGDDVSCSKINDDYVAAFPVVFTEEMDVQFVEIIVMKIE